MHILDEKLLNEIELYKSRIDRKKLDDFVREVFKCIAKETVLNVPIQDKDNAQRQDEVVRNFQIAWDYSTRNFAEPVEFDYLSDVAGRVEPSLCLAGRQYADFRNGLATCYSAYLPPVDETRVREHLDRTLKVLSQSDWHPVEKAVFLNFHLARIQPFQNGNKRVANIVMNSMLKVNDFFPIFIKPEQKPRFDGYIEGALLDFKESGAKSEDALQPYSFPGFGQRQFYDFLARTELSELKCAEDKMAHLLQYDVHFSDADPGQLYSAKHKLQSWLKAHQMLSQVRLDVHGRNMSVTGDIPQRSIESVLNSVPRIGKYELSVTRREVSNSPFSNPPFGK
jgi:hypothetical protein